MNLWKLLTPTIFVLMASPAATAITFEPPGEPAPRQTTAGATRSGEGICLSPGDRLIPLSVPNEIGLTTDDRPTLLVYVPDTSARVLEVTLAREDDGTELFRKQVSAPSEAGIVPVPLDEHSLEVDTVYQWYVSAICDDVDRSGNPLVNGWVKRVEGDDITSNTTEEYAEAGIWHETVLSLYERRQAQPGDDRLAADWRELLRSVGLEEVSDAPLGR